MENCQASVTKWLQCGKMGTKCAFLVNENLGDGDPDNMRKDLENNSVEYLKMLAKVQAGSSFRMCKIQPQITALAIKILQGE